MLKMSGSVKYVVGGALGPKSRGGLVTVLGGATGPLGGACAMAMRGTLAAATTPMALSSMRRDRRPLFIRLHEPWATPDPPPAEEFTGTKPSTPRGASLAPPAA